jgi:hypothetical protein
VSATRWILPLLAALVIMTPMAGGGAFGRTGKSDASVKQLAETLRTETDEKKRRAAVAELKDADPRTQGEVIPALVAALQRDRSPQVRADAAEVIGQFKMVFPLAGIALETAAEDDSSPAVRDAAHQALWEYYLAGYRSVGGEVFPGSTPEPPFAKPVVPRPLVSDPVPVVVTPSVSLTGAKPPPVIPSTAPVGSQPTASKPTSVGINLAPGTVVSRSPGSDHPSDRQPASLESQAAPVVSPFALRVVLTTAPPPELHMTAEPPLARVVDSAGHPTPTPSTTVDPASSASHSSLSLPLGSSRPPAWMIGLPDISFPPELR